MLYSRHAHDAYAYNSALRYKGVAKVTCRSAWKGFAHQLNPDAHWSSALYQGLNYVQYTDGTNIMNNDAAGFLFDMMSTHILHKTPVAERKYHKYSQCLSLIAGKRLCVWTRLWACGRCLWRGSLTWWNPVYWTEHHYTRGSIATSVSARSSGASYLNHVELQNRCIWHWPMQIFFRKLDINVFTKTWPWQWTSTLTG